MRMINFVELRKTAAKNLKFDEQTILPESSILMRKFSSIKAQL